MAPDPPASTLLHDVRPFDAQRDGMAVVSGFEVFAQVTYRSGRKSHPVRVALCPDAEIAQEIAGLLNGVYGPQEGT